MPYHSETTPASRLIGFGFVIALHIGIVYALVTGLATTAIEIIKAPLQVDTLIEKDQKKEAPPPPPPAALKPPPVYVPPPDINIQTESTANNAIQSVSSDHVNPKPNMAYNQLPEYPADARRLKAEGTVVIALDIDAKGHVTNAVIVEKSSLPSFDQAALDSIRDWRFKPAMNGGVATPVQGYKLKYVFRCKDAATGENNCN
jgi:protein TonB